MEYLLTGLRRSLTLGVLPASNLAASKLLVYADKLDNDTMTEQEVEEFAMFQAIRRADHASLRTFAKTFIGMGNDPAALLCLDHAFSSPLELQDLSFSEVEALLSLYFDYIRLLKKFRHDESLAQDSNRQRLFGFQVLGENRYLAPRHSILHEELSDRSGSSKKGMSGHTCGSDDLRRGITQLISARISVRTEAQDDACRGVHGFSTCLHLLIEEKCDSPDAEESCSFQHIQQEQLTSDWYNARLRLILLQFQILNSARYDNLDVKSYWLEVLYSALHPPVQRLGSLANLDIANIPDGADGLKIVREWVESVCYESDCYPGPVDRFRQWFTVAGTLAFDLDRENARYYITRTPLYRLMHEKSPIAQDYTTFLTAEARDSLARGSLYLRHVVRNGLRVDLNALCDLTERLSGMFIMAHRVNTRGLLHNITLPRSWFINLISPGADLGKDTTSFLKFASTIIELMQRIDAQVQQHPTPAPGTEEQFIADGDLTIDFTGPLYISRICLCLCLLGYNINDDEFKKGILTNIQSLRRGDRQSTPWFYRRYTDAESWDDLVHAFTRSLKNSSLDEMILLMHATIPSPHERRPKYVRLVSYNRLDRVPKLLFSGKSSDLRSGTTSAHQQRPYVEVATRAQPCGDHDIQGQQKHIDGTSQEKIHDDEEAEAVMTGGNQEEIDEALVNPTRVIQDAYHRHWERERTPAIRKIQAAYRRYLKRKSVVRKGIDATQAQYWDDLRKKSMEMEWSKDSRYYLLFRVPLAYILVCLDVIATFARSGKNEANRRLVAPDHMGIEDLMETTTQYSKLLKKTLELQRKLSPSSELHKGRSVSDLQQVVLEVEAVVESLDNIPGSVGTRSKIQERWDRGRKWIFEKEGSGAKGKKVERPRLVLES